MKIEIMNHGYNLDDKLKTLLLKKLKRLDKYFGAETAARLNLSQQGGNYIMEITIFAEKTVRAEASGADMNANIDLLIPRIKRQFRKEHTKSIAERG